MGKFEKVLETQNKGFRGTVVGGFKRTDVLRYIEAKGKALQEAREEKRVLEDICLHLRKRAKIAEDAYQESSTLTEELERERRRNRELEEKLIEKEKRMDEAIERLRGYEEVKERLGRLEIEAARRAGEIEREARMEKAVMEQKVLSGINELVKSREALSAELEASGAHIVWELRELAQRIEEQSRNYAGRTSELTELRQEIWRQRDAGVRDRSASTENGE